MLQLEGLAVVGSCSTDRPVLVRPGSDAGSRPGGKDWLAAVQAAAGAHDAEKTPTCRRPPPGLHLDCPGFRRHLPLAGCPRAALCRGPHASQLLTNAHYTESTAVGLPGPRSSPRHHDPRCHARQVSQVQRLLTHEPPTAAASSASVRANPQMLHQFGLPPAARHDLVRRPAEPGRRPSFPDVRH